MEDGANVVNLEGQAKIGFQAKSIEIQGNPSVDLSVNYNFNGGAAASHPENNGKIGYFNFDLSVLQNIIYRDSELEAIRAALKETTGSGAKIAILVGIGGAGKTTLARMSSKAEHVREPFENLIWVDAEETSNVTSTFGQLLNGHLQAKERLSTKQLVESVYSSILKHRTLIVFDNVEAVEDFKEFLPKVATSSEEIPPPQLIITTRVTEGWQDYKRYFVHVNQLSPELSQAYIRANLAESPLKIPDVDEKWAELVEYFGGLVIALRAATVSIVRQNELHYSMGQEAYTLETFLEEIKEVDISEETISDPQDPAPAEATYRTLRQLWTKTLNEISQRSHGHLAERILEVQAFLSPDGVPVHWFSSLLSKVPDYSQSSSMHAMSFLNSWSLVQRSEEKAMVHRVLHRTLQSRINSKRDKRIEVLSWLLPAFSQLHSELATDIDNKLHNFNVNLHSLVKNIESETFGNVPDAVVSFLVTMNLPGMDACYKLLQILIWNVFTKVALVSRESLKLLSTGLGDGMDVLLLTQWIPIFGADLPIREQLNLVKKALFQGCYHDYPQLYSSPAFYVTVSEVVAKWEPEPAESDSQAQLDVIETVKRICEGFCSWIEQYDLDQASKPEPELLDVLGNLKTGLIASFKGVFHQSYPLIKIEHRRVMLNSIQVAFKWYLTLVKLQETLPETKHFGTLDELDQVLAYCGVEHFMVAWYQEQFKRYYSACASSSSQNSDEGTELEARMAAAIIDIVVHSFSESKPLSGHIESINLFLVLICQSETCFEKMFGTSCFVHAYLVYLVLEPHLDLLEQQQPVEVTETPEFKSGIKNFLEVLTRLFNCCNNHCETLRGETMQVVEFFTETCMQHVVEVLFPKVQKISKVAGIEIEVCLCSTETEEMEHQCSAADPPACDCFSASWMGNFHQDKGAEATRASSKNQPKCFASICQMILAALDVTEGRTETTTEEASEAFVHQLHCHRRNQYYEMDLPVLDLLNSNRIRKNTEISREQKLRKIVTGNMEYLGPENPDTRKSQLILIRYLCSTGSTLEAADVAEKCFNSIVEDECCNFSKFISDVADIVLAVSMLLLLRGEKDRAARLLQCVLRKHARIREFCYCTSNVDCEKLLDRHGDFAQALLLIVTARRSSTTESSNNFGEARKSFRKGALIYCSKDGNSWRRRRRFKQWITGGKTNISQLDNVSERRLLNPESLVFLWFSTMESLFFGEPKHFSSTALFEPLETQIELRASEQCLNVEILLWNGTSNPSLECIIGKSYGFRGRIYKIIRTISSCFISSF